MSQKYKVFFYNNVVLLGGSDYDAKVANINLRYTDANNLELFLFGFLAKTTGQIVAIQHNNVDELWRVFCSLFEFRAAAGGLVQNANNQLLFIKRNGFWDLPKGHLEKGEDSPTGALREVEEECGIGNLQIVNLLSTTYHTYYYEERPVLKATDWYLMTCNGNTKTTPQTDEGISEATWMEPKQVPQLLANSYASIVEVIKSFDINLAPLCD